MNTTVVACDQCGKKNRVPAAASGVPQCSSCHAPLAWIADAADDNLAEGVEATARPALVHPWAAWCGPWRMLIPALELLAHDFAGRVKLVKVNVDESPRVAQRFGVQGIPTLLVVQGTNVLARQTGAAGEPALRAWLEDALARAEEHGRARE